MVWCSPKVSSEKIMERLNYWAGIVSVFYFLTFLIHTDCYPPECTKPFPRSYVVYHLNDHEVIDVDGKLDDKAWNSVSWTEDFIGEYLIFPRGLGTHWGLGAKR